MATLRKGIVFNIDEQLWNEFNRLVSELGSYNGRIAVKMIEYVLKNKEDFKKFFVETKLKS
jgi:hypothetical protein